MDNRPIGIFDSGAGGLTVLREIMDRLSNENVIYFGDTARFPYGSKTADELEHFVLQIGQFLVDEGVKFIVIACNSASSAGLEVAQRSFDVPVVGVIEPGARAAVRATRVKRVGVIGTRATIDSGAYTEAVRALDAGVEVYSCACPELADCVESGEVAGERVEELLHRHLQPLLGVGIDTLILGCTHYPPLAPAIEKVTGRRVRLISSAEETARELEEYLSRKGSLRGEATPPYVRLGASGDVQSFLSVGPWFLGRPIGEIERVTLPLAHVKGSR